MIPGLELPAERRLLFLWIFFVMGLGVIYYMKPNPTLLQRFERAYYTTYWNRPIEPVPAKGWPEDSRPSIGFITPAYISTLVDTEFWITVQNTSRTEVINPIIVITDQVTIVIKAKNSAEKLREIPVDAQILLREGENRTDINPNSRHAIRFDPLQPLEVSTRLVWARILPIASDPGQGDQPIYIIDENLESGEVSFSFYILNPDGTLPDDPLYSEDNNPTLIDTRQSVTRGFIRTLLLPPWANGLLVGLGFILAFITNSVVDIFEQRIRERNE